MQRRLTLAATLVHDPELLYLDEPTAGVDPILRERFWAHFRTLRDQGRTIVVPTQYVGEAVSCDVVAVMADGRLVTVQPPTHWPGSPTTAILLAVDFETAGWPDGVRRSCARTVRAVVAAPTRARGRRGRRRRTTSSGCADHFAASGVAVERVIELWSRPTTRSS